MLQARIDPNVEVITTLLNLTANGAGEWNAGMPSQPYRREVMQRFAHLREHPAVQKANQLHAQGFWWDAMIQLALTCTAFPEAILTTPLPNSRYTDAGDGDAEAGKRAIADFLPLVDDFYERARFDNFYREQQPRYEGIMAEVSACLPDASWLDLVGNYYGAGAGDDARGFYLVPSPLSIAGHGFGNSVHRDDEIEIYHTFAPFCSVEPDADGHGFDSPQSLAELSVHEFGHSFVNHLLEPPHYADVIERFVALYAAERESGQMGWSPRVNVAEHIIRACEVRIALVANQPQDAARLLQHHIDQYGCRHLPEIVDAMDDYEQNRERYPSLTAFMPELMRCFDEIALRHHPG